MQKDLGYKGKGSFDGYSISKNTEIEDRTIDSHVKEFVKNSKRSMKNFQRLKQNTEVDIDGMLVDEKKKNLPF